VPGVTILDSAGAHRVGSWLSQVGLSAIDRLFEARELRRHTLLAAIDDEDLLDRAVAEAERVVGGFDQPNTGVLLVLPVARASGLHKLRLETEQELPPPIRPEVIALRDIAVGELSDKLGLKPAMVSAGTPLDEVARTILVQPGVQAACVVAEDGRLIGLLDIRAVVDNLFLQILPEEFLSKISDLDDVIEFADISRMRTAADAMQEPAWVMRDESIKEAFKKMHERHLSGLPVVDDSYRVTGYVSLVDLLSVFLGDRSPSREPGEVMGR
jgi:CBS domain-containing protein